MTDYAEMINEYFSIEGANKGFDRVYPLFTFESKRDLILVAQDILDLKLSPEGIDMEALAKAKVTMLSEFVNQGTFKKILEHYKPVFDEVGFLTEDEVEPLAEIFDRLDPEKVLSSAFRHEISAHSGHLRSKNKVQNRLAHLGASQNEPNQA